MPRFFRTITDLEAGGHVTKIRECTRLKYPINPNLCLRTQMLQDKAVSDFMEVLGWDRRHRQVLKEKTG